MMNTNHRLETLIERYYEGETTPAEEQELLQELEAQETLSAEEKALCVMLQGFASIKCENIIADKNLAAPQPIPRNKGRMVRLAIGFSAVAAVVAIALFSTPRKEAIVVPAEEPTVYCYINGEPITDLAIAMEQTKYLEPIKEISQSVATLESIINI